MPEDIRIWRIVDTDSLKEIKKTKLNLEERIEEWLEKDITILSSDLLIIGRQVETGFGGFIDLLCLNRNGDTVIVELKRDKTPREITAQVIDYASWVKDLSNERITDIANNYLGDQKPLDVVFREKFNEDLPEILNQDHQMLIVASIVADSSERIINYLSDSYGVSINAATFQYFRDGEGKEYLARVFLIQPSEVEYNVKEKGPSKRAPSLSYEALEEIAERNNVRDLYKQLVEELTYIFGRKDTTRSSIRFVGKINDSKKAILNLIPKDSNANDGVKFQVYIYRLSDYLGVDPKRIVSLLPENKEEWSYEGAAQPSKDWSGYTGFFKKSDEVKKFVNGLKEIKKNDL